MLIAIGQQLKLLDSQERNLGTLLVDRVDGQGISGPFTPGDDFSTVRELFSEWIASANDQSFMEVDRLDAELTRLKLRVRRSDGSESAVEECQPGGQRMSLRVARSISLNGAVHANSRSDPSRV
jgi:hypothetical protein